MIECNVVGPIRMMREVGVSADGRPQCVAEYHLFLRPGDIGQHTDGRWYAMPPTRGGPVVCLDDGYEVQATSDGVTVIGPPMVDAQGVRWSLRDNYWREEDTDADDSRRDG